jgi:ApaG protein
MKEYLLLKTSKTMSISVTPHFSFDRSFPELDHYVWEYKIRIKNKQNKTINILKSNFSIVDMLGRRIPIQHDDNNQGKACLNPNEEYEYTDFTPLTVPMGMMQGWYDFEDQEGSVFKECIPLVSLDSPFHDCLIH